MVHFSHFYSSFNENQHKISPKRQHKKQLQNLQPPPDIDSPPFYLPLRKFSDRYKVISNLGNGSFGSVSLAKINVDLNNQSNFKAFRNTLLERNVDYKYENVHNKNSGLVAIKTMTKRLPHLNDYTRVKEVRFILSLPYHRNMVQIYEMFIDDSEFKLHIVMECLDQNLYQLIKARKNNHFSLFTLRSILSQVLNGIRHIHRNDFFHRDIKPENILVSPTNRFFESNYVNSDLFKYKENFIVKIADYGLARHIDNKRPYTSYVSTRWYRAPEILLRKNWYSRPVDIWAFGSVAAELATFRPLFPGSNELEQTWKVLEVLGTPLSSNTIDHSYYPSYGYWDEAMYLSAQLGLKFPQNKCIDIIHVIPNIELRPLCDVIRTCLAWDPSTRADVEQICQMPYFKNTCVDEYEYRLPESSKYPSGQNQQSMTPGKSKLSTFNLKSNYDKSEKLNGIPSLKKQTPRSYLKPDLMIHHHGSSNEMPVNFISSNPSTTEVDASFLSELHSLSTNPIEKQPYENFTHQNVEGIYSDPESNTVPQLTRDSTETENDENFDLHGLITTSPLQIDKGLVVPEERKTLKSLSSNPKIALLQSFINSSSHLDTPGDINYYHFNDRLKGYTYDAHRDYENNLTMPDQEQTATDEFINWDKLNTNPESLLHAPKLINDVYEKSPESYQQLNDSLLGLYEKEITEISYDNAGVQEDADITDGSQFSENLYSKFNLRRFTQEPQDALKNNIYQVDKSFDSC